MAISVGKARLYRARAGGFTLLEVLVAIAIVAVITVLSVQSLDSATRANEVTQRKMKEIHRFDRFWRFIEMDLRNALKYNMITPLGEAFAAMQVDQSELHFLSVLRAGIANPLMSYRTELGRVGYRIEENTVWRDSWRDPLNPDEDLAYKQKLYEGVEEVLIFVLPPGVDSADERLWIDQWPAPGVAVEALPLALKVNVILDDGRDITRLFLLPTGE